MLFATSQPLSFKFVGSISSIKPQVYAAVETWHVVGTMQSWEFSLQLNFLTLLHCCTSWELLKANWGLTKPGCWKSPAAGETILVRVCFSFLEAYPTASLANCCHQNQFKRESIQSIVHTSNFLHQEEKEIRRDLRWWWAHKLITRFADSQAKCKAAEITQKTEVARNEKDHHVCFAHKILNEEIKPCTKYRNMSMRRFRVEDAVVTHIQVKLLNILAVKFHFRTHQLQLRFWPDSFDSHTPNPKNLRSFWVMWTVEFGTEVRRLDIFCVRKPHVCRLRNLWRHLNFMTYFGSEASEKIEFCNYFRLCSKDMGLLLKELVPLYHNWTQRCKRSKWNISRRILPQMYIDSFTESRFDQIQSRLRSTFGWSFLMLTISS